MFPVARCGFSLSGSKVEHFGLMFPVILSLSVLCFPPPSGASKWDIRQKVWDYIEEKNLANFPRPVHNRIPNFKAG